MSLHWVAISKNFSESKMYSNSTFFTIVEVANKNVFIKIFSEIFPPPRASFNSQKDYPTTTTAADTFLQYLISLSLVNQSILKAVCSSTTTTVATQPVIIFNINFSIIKGNLIEIKRFGKTV